VSQERRVREERREAEARKVVADLLKLLSTADRLEFEDVVIDARELTIEFIPPSAPTGPTYLKLTVEPVGVPQPPGGKLEFILEVTPTGFRLLTPPVPGAVPITVPPIAAVPKLVEFIKVEYKYPSLEFKGSIAEVKIGATKAEGGTRSTVIKIGGDNKPPIFRFLGYVVNRPKVALDVFDTTIPLPRAVRDAYGDVLSNPYEWAKKCINVVKADLISFHLVSTDPGIKDVSPQEAAKEVEQMLQTIDIPFIVGGCGNPVKDLETFAKVAEVAANERLVLASVTFGMNIPKYVEVVKKFNHVALALIFMDVTQAKAICRRLMDLGLSKDRIILDPTTAALGYGTEYSFSAAERIRLAALRGDEDLQVPMSCAATNAWAAREAWMKLDAWGPREWRGPLWEAVTAMTMLLAGADLFMMMHPLAASIVKSVTEFMEKQTVRDVIEKEVSEYYSWVTKRY